MILEEIAAKARERGEADKEKISLSEMKRLAFSHKSKLDPFAFENALRDRDISFICEVKKASPSKGVIAEDFPYVEIAMEYEEALATCVSVLTEPYYFLGSDEYLKEIREAINIPIIRKDFTIDEYQIYQAKALGADCVLLICALLDTETLKEYLKICDELSISAIVETHDEEEIKSAIEAGARIIGVNNRNLKNFTVNVANSTSLRNLVPEDVIFVAESGIKDANDINELRKNNVDAVLIGETLMRADDKRKMLASLKGTMIKICGLKRMEDVEIVNKYKPDFVGFVFANTKRFVSDELAVQMKNALDKSIKVVGVFQNDTIEHFEKLCGEGAIDAVQIHGDESEEFVSEVMIRTGKPVIRALKGISRACLEADFKRCVADYIMVDSVSARGFGGTGKTFDLSILPESNKKIFVAGGIDEDNVDDIIDTVFPYCVDVSSRVESDGFKDEEKIKRIIEKVRTHYER